MGGTAFAKAGNDDVTTFLVGSEGGSLYKANIQQPVDKDVSHLFEGSKLRWKQEAMNLLGNLPPKQIMEVKKVVERFALDKGDKDIWAPLVFHAKPDIKFIFANAFNANYERCLAPITAIDASPFVKRIFLTASLDGILRLFDVLNQRPITSFEPGLSEYLLDV